MFVDEFNGVFDRYDMTFFVRISVVDHCCEGC